MTRDERIAELRTWLALSDSRDYGFDRNRARRILFAALDVVAQARNVSPIHCGATRVLSDKVSAFDAALGATEDK